MHFMFTMSRIITAHTSVAGSDLNGCGIKPFSYLRENAPYFVRVPCQLIALMMEHILQLPWDFFLPNYHQVVSEGYYFHYLEKDNWWLLNIFVNPIFLSLNRRNSAVLFGAASGAFVLYLGDSEAILGYLPVWGSKYKYEPPKWMWVKIA